MAVAEPVRDLRSPLKGPFRAKPLAMPDAAAAALKLARLAGILPAFFLLEGDVETEVQVDTVDIEAYDDAARLAIAKRARLPVTASATAENVAFRSPAEPPAPIARLIGKPDESGHRAHPPSQCLTGERLGYPKCQCGAPLPHAPHQKPP